MNEDYRAFLARSAALKKTSTAPIQIIPRGSSTSNTAFGSKASSGNFPA